MIQELKHNKENSRIYVQGMPIFYGTWLSGYWQERGKISLRNISGSFDVNIILIIKFILDDINSNL